MKKEEIEAALSDLEDFIVCHSGPGRYRDQRVAFVEYIRANLPAAPITVHEFLDKCLADPNPSEQTKATILWLQKMKREADFFHSILPPGFDANTMLPERFGNHGRPGEPAPAGFINVADLQWTLTCPECHAVFETKSVEITSEHGALSVVPRHPASCSNPDDPRDPACRGSNVRTHVVRTKP